MKPSPLELKSEMTNDTAGIGYAAVPVGPSRDDAVARLINARRATIDLLRDDVAPHEILGAIDLADFAGASAAHRAYLQLVLSAPRVAVTAALKAALETVFGAGTATRAALPSVFTRKGSRAEQLGWEAVSPSDVADARRA